MNKELYRPTIEIKVWVEHRVRFWPVVASSLIVLVVDNFSILLPWLIR